MSRQCLRRVLRRIGKEGKVLELEVGSFLGKAMVVEKSLWRRTLIVEKSLRRRTFIVEDESRDRSCNSVNREGKIREKYFYK